MADGTNTFNVAPEGGDPFDQLLAQVREAATGVYDVLGEMGRSKSGNVVYLAREIESGHLVAMKLSRSKGGSDFDLEVVKTLDTAIPGLESKCPECKEVLGDWDRFCFRCGADLSAAEFNPAADEAGRMMEAVKEATQGVYEIYGKMARADGAGVVFFARDLARDKVVALRLKKDAGPDADQGAYSIDETQVFKPLAAELGATQVLGAGLAPPPMPPAQPKQPPPARPSTPVPQIAADIPMAEPSAVHAAAPAPPGPAPAAGGAKAPPWRLIGGIAAGVVVVLVGYFAFRGGDEPVEEPPVVPPAVVDTAAPIAVAVVDSPPVEEPPPAATTTVAEFGTIVIGVPLPPGGRALVDGRAVSGNSVRLRPGRHNLVLSADGYETVRERLTVAAGETRVWRPTLARVPDEPPSTRAAPPPPPPPPTCARAFSRGEWASALELCRTAATGNDATAQRLLGKIYDEGHGVTQDRAEASQWYIKAASSGDREAQERLGYIYRDGLGIRKDETRSTLFFRQAAEGGRAAAQLELGVALENGRGVRENDTEAATWYQRASEGGNAQAARRLGRLYERGHGVQKSEAEAARWYRVAGDRGDAEAQYYLGRFYKDGKGVEKSEAQALEWFKRAAAQGHKDAQDEARKLENR